MVDKKTAYLKKLLMSLNKAETELQGYLETVEKYEQVYAPCHQTDLQQDSHYLHCKSEIPVLQARIENMKQAYYGREIESCKHRMYYNGDSSQRNALRVEFFNPCRYRCLCRLKPAVQELAERVGLFVFGPLDWEPCLYNEYHDNETCHLFTDGDI